MTIGRRVLGTLLSVPIAVGLAPLLLSNRWRSWRREAEPRPVERIILLELWGIGDLVLATGALRALRACYPTARITVLAKLHATTLLGAQDFVDEVVAYDFPWTAFRGKYRLGRYRLREIAALLRSLRRRRFDLAVNGRSDPRNNLLLAVIGASRSVSLKTAFANFAVTHAVERVHRDAHRVEDWQAVIARASGSASSCEPVLCVGENEQRVADRFLESRGIPPDAILVGVHPGARIPVRRWHLDRFGELADELIERHGARVLVFADEQGYGSDIPMRHPAIVVKPTLSELVALTSRCRLLLCNDSAPMHIAAALGVPVVAVFGPTKAEWFRPRGTRHRVVIQDGYPCRPCFDRCRFRVAGCIEHLPTEMVRRELDAALISITGACASV